MNVIEKTILVTVPNSSINESTEYKVKIQFDEQDYWIKTIEIKASNEVTGQSWTELGLQTSNANVKFGENGEVWLVLDGKKVKIDVCQFEKLYLLTQLHQLYDKYPVKLLEVKELEK